MLTEKTLIQLLSHQRPEPTPERARELGRLGYMQWLGGQAADVAYPAAALRALRLAQPFAAAAPAVAEFCDLLSTSILYPLAPLDLALPPPRRRGGARMRRLSL